MLLNLEKFLRNFLNILKNLEFLNLNFLGFLREKVAMGSFFTR